MSAEGQGAPSELVGPSYDDEGSVVGKSNPSTGESWVYALDNANHLITAIHKDGSNNVIATVTEKYDVMGRRVEEDTTQGGNTTVQRFAWDGSNNVWADLNGSNQLQTRRLYLDHASPGHKSCKKRTLAYLSEIGELMKPQQVARYS